MNAAERWAKAMPLWGVPQEIADAAPESPWGFPPALFRSRAASALQRPRTESHLRALEALPEGGTVLDVGVGAGAGSLPLTPSPSVITGVDSSQGMLDSFREAAATAGAAVDTVLGDWPDVSDQLGLFDVVVCHHVLYNVQDAPPFLEALSRHARRRVVIEMTPEHPLAWMRDLWKTFHNVERPLEPTYLDAVEIARDLGFDVQSAVTEGPPVMSGFDNRDDAVAFIRKRLCLWPKDDGGLAEALGDRLNQRGGLWSAAPREHQIATLWWDNTVS